ncbi:hypothetical protein FKP32DRAFT_1083836 [Trametes sanguinea]|nr:hypothetical protein FKP32DRAFT_1083836 [Trametes sanguinea]
MAAEHREAACVYTIVPNTNVDAEMDILKHGCSHLPKGSDHIALRRGGREHTVFPVTVCQHIFIEEQYRHRKVALVASHHSSTTQEIRQETRSGLRDCKHRHGGFQYRRLVHSNKLLVLHLQR